MSAFPTVVSLGTLSGVQHIRLIGRADHEWLGESAAIIGDVNGDGLADIMLGGRLDPAFGSLSNTSAYLMLGRAPTGGTLDLGIDNPGVVRFGDWPAGSFGTSTTLTVTGLGDFNNDGFGDAVIGSPRTDAGGSARGAIQLLLGGPGGVMNAGQLNGAANGSQLGTSFAGLGDVNGDGIPDLGFVDLAFPEPTNSAITSSVFISFGSQSGYGSFARISDPAGDSGPRSVFAAGDFTADGIADIAVATPFGDRNGRTDAGSVMLVMGRADGATPPPRLRIDGAAAGDQAGTSVAAAGDVNGDGITDLLIGAPYADSLGRTDNGIAYLVFGRRDGQTLIDLANAGTGAIRIHGSADYDGTGIAVASGGDVNGDGYADMMIGAMNWDPTPPFTSQTGATWLVLGGPGLAPDIDLSAPPTNVIRFQGAASGHRNGMAVGGAGDVDGDGFSDLLLLSPSASEGGHNTNGAAYILFSASTGGITRRGTLRTDTLLGGAEADTLHGLDGDDWLQGRLGHDALFGGSGHDTLDGGAGRDTMDGGIENDTYVQHDLDDVIIDSAGDDTLWLLVNAPIAAGIETTRLAGAADNITGTARADQIVANAARASRIDGADGHDHIWGGPFAHTLLGGAGDDTLRGQDGAARLEGGAGDDHLVVGHLGAVLVEGAGQGTDTAWVSVNGYTLPLHVEIARLAGTATQLTGSAGAEQLVANPLLASNLNGGLGDDVLWGSAGADTLNGDWGDDTIRGQGGADQMWGGWGNDHFVILQADVTAHEADGQGWDTAWVAADGWTAQPYIEQIMLSGGAGVVHANDQANLIGGNATRANAIIGAGGDDTIFGGGFADTLTGGAGNDVLYGMGGADVFVYAASGWGYDQIAGFTAGLSKLDFSSTWLSFGMFRFNEAGGNTQIEYDGNAILLHGVVAVSPSDFLFRWS